jgi:general secretion pathway protein L
MSLLRIHIPSSWPDDAEPDATLPWCRLGSRGEALDAGSAALADLPRTDACELVIPAERVLLTHALLPRGSRQKMRQLLPYAIEDKLVNDPDTVHVAAGATRPDGQLALAAVDKAWLARVLARLNAAGLHPRSAWPETLLPALPPDGWVMVWDGRSGFLRSGAQAGLSLDEGSAGQPPAALILSVAEARATASLPKQLQVRLHPGAASPDIDVWREALGVPVELGEAWLPMQHPDTPSGAINLLQGEFASSNLARDWWPALRVPLILASLLLLLQVGATTTEWVLLKREKQQLQSAMEQHFRTAFPDARVVVDAPLQMQRNLAELQGASRQLAPGDFLPLLARTATALDADSRNRLRTVHYDNGQLKLEVALPDRVAADALLARLNGAGLASRIDDVSGAAPQSLARITITGNTP